jgi:hypothetical protein
MAAQGARWGSDSTGYSPGLPVSARSTAFMRGPSPDPANSSEHPELGRDNDGNLGTRRCEISGGAGRCHRSATATDSLCSADGLATTTATQVLLGMMYSLRFQPGPTWTGETKAHAVHRNRPERLSCAPARAEVDGLRAEWRIIMSRPGFDGHHARDGRILGGLAAFCTYAWPTDAELVAASHASRGLLIDSDPC